MIEWMSDVYNQIKFRKYATQAWFICIVGLISDEKKNITFYLIVASLLMRNLNTKALFEVYFTEFTLENVRF